MRRLSELVYNIDKPVFKAGPKTLAEYPLNRFIINGVWYDKSPEAMVACGVKNYQTLKDRSKSFAYPNVISVKDPAGKTIPNNIEIQQKFQDYYSRYGRKTDLTVRGKIVNISSSQEMEQSTSPCRLSPYIYKGKWYDTEREAYAEASKEGVIYGSFKHKVMSPYYPDILSVNNPVGRLGLKPVNRVMCCFFI